MDVCLLNVKVGDLDDFVFVDRNEFLGFIGKVSAKYTIKKTISDRGKELYYADINGSDVYLGSISHY